MVYRAVSVGKWLPPPSFRRNVLPSCTGSKKVDKSVIVYLAKLRVIQRHVSTDEGESCLCLPCGAQSWMYV
jgi:hypothetical protein